MILLAGFVVWFYHRVQKHYMCFNTSKNMAEKWMFAEFLDLSIMFVTAVLFSSVLERGKSNSLERFDLEYKFLLSTVDYFLP